MAFSVLSGLDWKQPRSSLHTPNPSALFLGPGREGGKQTLGCHELRARGLSEADRCLVHAFGAAHARRDEPHAPPHRGTPRTSKGGPARRDEPEPSRVPRAHAHRASPSRTLPARANQTRPVLPVRKFQLRAPALKTVYLIRRLHLRALFPLSPCGPFFHQTFSFSVFGEYIYNDVINTISSKISSKGVVK
jgi:hypothetical protein